MEQIIKIIELEETDAEPPGTLVPTISSNWLFRVVSCLKKNLSVSPKPEDVGYLNCFYRKSCGVIGTIEVCKK